MPNNFSCMAMVHNCQSFFLFSCQIPIVRNLFFSSIVAFIHPSWYTCLSTPSTRFTMAKIHHLFHSQPLLIVLVFLVPVVLAAGGKHGTVQYHHTQRVPFPDLKQVILPKDEQTSTSSPKKPKLTGKGFVVLEMRHPYAKKISDEHKQHSNLLTMDELRVRKLQSRIKSSVYNSKFDESQVQIPLTIGISLQTLNYLVTIELGGKNATVIMDTGSDLTWVQCQPCKSCYNQQDPLFDPTISPTFQSIVCNSTACGFLQYAAGLPAACAFTNSNCQYMVNYGDGSYTRGELGRETLTFDNTSVNDFVFGCGRSNKGLFGGASGLLGLGRGELSLVRQTKEFFGGVFSYCFPDRDSKSGSLVLGPDSSCYKNETTISYTKMITNERMRTFYFLNFTGASIGGVPVQTVNAFGNSKTLIDSGTVITRLVPSLYTAIKEEFLKQFSGYPPAPAFSILDTCFNFSAYSELEVPTLKLEFEGGVEVKIHVSGMFYFVKKDSSQVCLALASLSSDDQTGIIGNYQQKNLRIVYDTQESKLGFAEETCSY